MKRRGIHFRLLLAGFLLISATTIVLGYMGVKISHQFVQTRFEERMRFLARYLALNAELGILIDERNMLERLAENLLSEKDVVQVTIFNRFEEPLADKSRKATGRLSVVQVPVLLKEMQDESRLFQWQTGDGAGERIIGTVEITYTTEGINRLLGTMKSRFIWIAVTVAALSVFIFYFISRSLVAPVSRLAHAARQVAGGNLTLRVKADTSLPETRELSLAFNAMLDSIEESQKALETAHQRMLRQKMLAEMGKFSMMIAHEVKNPLSIIKSSLDVLKKDHDGLTDDMLVGFIEDEIRRLNRLIEDFLMFSRPAEPAFRSVDVHAMLQECLIRIELQTGEGVSIEHHIPDEPLPLAVDPDLLVRSFSNIIKNAIESDGRNNHICVRSCHNGKSWSVEISDQGCGIAPEHLEKIFEPFFTTRAKGTGLGLAFTAQVIKAHGGHIYARNGAEKGAVFRVEIPVNHRKEWLTETRETLENFETADESV